MGFLLFSFREQNIMQQGQCLKATKKEITTTKESTILGPHRILFSTPP